MTSYTIHKSVRYRKTLITKNRKVMYKLMGE